jgi:DNA-directed RNA polymerase specialized sigma24 family protein
MSDSSFFPTTQWTSIIEAVQRGEDVQARESAESFCKEYYNSIWRFFISRGLDEETAKDHTQEFLYRHLLADNDGFVHRARRDLGKFRTFLGTCLYQFLCDQHRRGMARKRGGQIPHRSIEEAQETAPAALPSVPADFVEHFDRVYAEALMERICEGARDRQLLNLLTGDAAPEDLAQEWAVTEGAVRTALTRFRGRFRQRVRDDVRRTLPPGATEDDVDEEIRHLMRTLGSEA